MQPEFSIKENSWQAKIAARKMRTSAVAMVLGSTIHLHNKSKKQKNIYGRVDAIK